MSAGAPPASARDAAADGSGRMFDAIADRYDRLNRLMSFSVDRRWRRKTVGALELEPGDRVLDVATGTADLALEIVRRAPGVQVVGVDPSSGMLEVGQGKVADLGLTGRIELVEGDAQELAFGDGSFAASCIAFGIRNVPDRRRALAEMARVTRDGGRIAVLELTEPRRGVVARLARFHVHHVVPRLGALLSGREAYRYLQRSIAAFPPVEEFVGMMEAAGIGDVAVHRFAFGACHLFVGRSAEGAARSEDVVEKS